MRTRGAPRARRADGRHPSGRARKSAAIRRHVIALGWRAVVWLALVFIAVPFVFDVGGAHKQFSFNADVAGLFVLALLGAFAIWRRQALLRAPITFRWRQAVLTCLLALLLFGMAYGAQLSYMPQSTYISKALIIIWMQMAYAFGALLLAITLYGIDLFLKERRALLTGAVVGVSYVGLSLLFRQLWPLLSSLVTGINVWVLGMFGDASVMPGAALKFNTFYVIIGEACSGVDSAILFSGVFLFIALLDWPRLKHKLFIGMLPFGLIGMFLINVLRVGMLMMVGAWCSPEFALTLFHANAGWMLFVLYTLGFWWWAYPRVRLAQRTR